MDEEKKTTTELYGARSCRYTDEMREELEWKGRSFMLFLVDEDDEALERLRGLTGAGPLLVPVLVENGSILQIGYKGMGCYVHH